MTKGNYIQILRQKWSARTGNWYKWLQISCEAERVLIMWQRDLRDSCKSFLHHYCWHKALTQSGSASAPAIHSQHCCPAPSAWSQGAPLPLSPHPQTLLQESSTQAWATAQTASVDYAAVASHQWTHSLTAYGRWMNTCLLSGAERGAGLFPGLVPLISPSWSCKAECASVILLFSGAAMLQWSLLPKAMGFLACLYGGCRKESERHLCSP